MKDLLKDFKIQRVLNQLSDQTIDLLVAKFCDEPKPDLKSLRQSPQNMGFLKRKNRPKAV